MTDHLTKRIQAAKRFEEKREFDKAREIYDDLARKHPENPTPWVCLGALEDEISRQGSGLFGGKEYFAKATSIRVIPTVLNDIANILLRNELEWERAEKLYKEAVIRHGLKEAAQNLAVCLLNTATVKNIPEGWREAWQWYEWRDMHKLRDHEMLWRGESLKGKRLLIQFEQGFGDHVWALRFVKQAKQEGATTIVVCQPNTIRLASAQDYVDEVYNIQEDAAVETDYVTMLMSMPGYMMWMPTAEGRYISSGITAPRSAKRRVGIAWAGSVDKGYQSWRNVPLECLKPLIDAHPDIEWVSLQKGHHSTDCRELSIDRESIEACADLWDTAQLVETLDLVISTDTLIPHLSAALGVETWLLDRWSSCWQFGIGDSDPHFYEFLKIFRQPSFGEWAAVLDEVKARLKAWKSSTAQVTAQSSHTMRKTAGSI